MSSSFYKTEADMVGPHHGRREIGACKGGGGGGTEVSSEHITRVWGPPRVVYRSPLGR